MTIEYKLYLSQAQIEMLFWVQDDCPDMDTELGKRVMNNMGFIRSAKKFVSEGILLNDGGKPPFQFKKREKF